MEKFQSSDSLNLSLFENLYDYPDSEKNISFPQGRKSKMISVQSIDNYCLQIVSTDDCKCPLLVPI